MTGYVLCSEAIMENPERLFSQQVGRENESAVPGLEQLIEDFRAAYPELSQQAIRRVLRLPPEIKEGPESPREV